MMLTLYNSLSQLNEFADEATYRLSGKVEMNGQPNISLSTMQASGRNADARAAWCWPAGGATSSTACT